MKDIYIKKEEKIIEKDIKGVTSFKNELISIKNYEDNMNYNNTSVSNFIKVVNNKVKRDFSIIDVYLKSVLQLLLKNDKIKISKVFFDYENNILNINYKDPDFNNDFIVKVEKEDDDYRFIFGNTATNERNINDLSLVFNFEKYNAVKSRLIVCYEIFNSNRSLFNDDLPFAIESINSNFTVLVGLDSKTYYNEDVPETLENNYIKNKLRVEIYNFNKENPSLTNIDIVRGFNPNYIKLISSFDEINKELDDNYDDILKNVYVNIFDCPRCVQKELYEVRKQEILEKTGVEMLPNDTIVAKVLTKIKDNFNM